MDRRILIGIGILVLVALGFLFITNMTGNVITGSVSNHKVIDNEYFKINEFKNQSNNSPIENDSIVTGTKNNK